MYLKFVEKTDLHFIDNHSDKVYHAAIIEQTERLSPSIAPKYTVDFAYGRRGNALTYGQKTSAAGDYKTAKKIFDKIVSEKTEKGYVPKPGISGKVFHVDSIMEGPAPSPKGEDLAADIQATEQAAVANPVNLKSPKTKVGFLPQLLNPIEEAELPAFFADHLWGMQEKKDGKRCMAVSSGSPTNEIFGVNRKGQKFPLPPDTIATLRGIGRQAIIDCELIGDTLFAFGLLEFAGKDLRPSPYIKSYNALENIFLETTSLRQPGSKLKLVPLFQTKIAKMGLYEEMKKDGREGIVLKKLNAPYSEGRPNSGGDCLKFKFYATASVLVLGVNTGKRSVQMGVVPASEGFFSFTSNNAIRADLITPIGNVTIPPNHEVPNKGDIVEVRYLYAFPDGGSLFQPIYLGKRDDLEGLDCSISQLKYINRPEAPEPKESNTLSVSPGL